MNKGTVVQKAIELYRKALLTSQKPNELVISVNMVIEHLESLLPEEKKQMQDAYNAGETSKRKLMLHAEVNAEGYRDFNDYYNETYNKEQKQKSEQ